MNGIISPGRLRIINIFMPVTECTEGADFLLWSILHRISPLHVKAVIRAGGAVGQPDHGTHLPHGIVDVLRLVEVGISCVQGPGIQIHEIGIIDHALGDFPLVGPETERSRSPSCVREVIGIEGGLAVVLHSRGSPERRFVRKLFGSDVDAAPSKISRLIRSEGLGRIDALQSRPGEKIHVDRPLVRIRRGQPSSIHQRVDVSVGQTADDDILSVDHRGSDHPLQRIPGGGGSQFGNQIRPNGVQHSRGPLPFRQKPGFRGFF